LLMLHLPELLSSFGSRASLPWTSHLVRHKRFATPYKRSIRKLKYNQRAKILLRPISTHYVHVLKFLCFENTQTELPNYAILCRLYIGLRPAIHMPKHSKLQTSKNLRHITTIYKKEKLGEFPYSTCLCTHLFTLIFVLLLMFNLQIGIFVPTITCLYWYFSSKICNYLFIFPIHPPRNIMSFSSALFNI
jgi:hypothetical protein